MDEPGREQRDDPEDPAAAAGGAPERAPAAQHQRFHEQLVEVPVGGERHRHGSPRRDAGHDHAPHGTPAIVPASAAAASAIAAASTAGSTYASPRTSEPLTLKGREQERQPGAVRVRVQRLRGPRVRRQGVDPEVGHDL